MWFSSPCPLPSAGASASASSGPAEVTLSRLRRRGTSRSEVGKVSTDSGSRHGSSGRAAEEHTVAPPDPGHRCASLRNHLARAAPRPRAPHGSRGTRADESARSPVRARRHSPRVDPPDPGHASAAPGPGLLLPRLQPARLQPLWPSAVGRTSSRHIDGREGPLCHDLLATVHRVAGALPVLLVRHPGAVLSSYRRMGWSPDLDEIAPLALEHLGEDVRSHGDAAADMGAFWSTLHRLALLDIHESGAVVVFHEDLALGGTGALRTLFRRCGLEWNSAVAASAGAAWGARPLPMPSCRTSGCTTSTGHRRPWRRAGVSTSPPARSRRSSASPEPPCVSSRTCDWRYHPSRPRAEEQLTLNVASAHPGGLPAATLPSNPPPLAGRRRYSRDLGPDVGEVQTGGNTRGAAL